MGGIELLARGAGLGGERGRGQREEQAEREREELAHVARLLVGCCAKYAFRPRASSSVYAQA